eukprot:g27064.t1
MAEAQERAKEEDRRRAIEQQMREKEEHDRHRAELKERLRQDYIDRFGCEPPEEKDRKRGSIMLHDEVKFKKLKLDNKAFQSRIVPYDGALDVLDVLGFEKKEDRQLMPCGLKMLIAL